MLDPSIFTLPITGHSCPPGISAFFFFLLLFGRGYIPDQGLFGLLLAYGFFEQDKWPVTSVSSKHLSS